LQNPWEDRFAQRMQNMRASAIRELLKMSNQPGFISFGGGFPAPEVFPIEAFRAACNKVLLENGLSALQYSVSEGLYALREMIVERSLPSGQKITPENVMITTGSQQALDLIGKIFINRGDRILVESPTYIGALQAWNAYGAEYISISSDENGVNTDEVEAALQQKPKFMYVIPTFQNPTGVTISLERRKRIVELGNKYGVFIVEDDPYGQLRFEGEHLPTIGALDCQERNSPGVYDGNIIYLSTFSKILAPGLRLAWVIAAADVIQKLVLAKQGTDLHSSTFNQYIAWELGKGDFLDQHIKKICQVYHERRDVMLDALEEHMPKGIQWTRPDGGLFLGVNLDARLNSRDVLAEAVKEKVVIIPGDSFFPLNGGENTMRLNFSNASPELINEGISRLGLVLRRMM
jgi:2-aminoadipate transaminase